MREWNEKCSISLLFCFTVVDHLIISFLYYHYKGHIFAADNKYYGYLIPTIGHSVVINILNKLYRSVAHFCTDLENHR